MKSINRNGLKYEIITNIITPGSPAIPARTDPMTQVFTPAVAAVPAVTEDIETGRIVGVEVTITPDPSIATAHVRTAELLSLTEEIDLEMIVQARINFYDSDGVTPMLTVIDADTTLSPDAKALKQQLFQSFTLAPKRTRESYVNPSTGQILPAGDTSGVREIQFYQNLTKAMLTGMGLPIASESREQFIRYHMIAFMLQSIVQRVGI